MPFDSSSNSQQERERKPFHSIRLVGTSQTEMSADSVRGDRGHSGEIPVTPSPFAAQTNIPETPLPDIEQWLTQPELPVIHPWSLDLVVTEKLLASKPSTQPDTQKERADTDKTPQVGSESRQEQKSYVALIRDLVKSSGVYALASMASPLISLVLAPFLTHSLSHDDYGVLAVLSTVISLVAGITQLGQSSAFFRAYNYDYETEEDRLGVFSTVVIILFLTSIPVALLSLLVAPQLSMLLFGTAIFANPLRVTALVILCQNLTVPGFAWLRAEGRSGFFSLLAIGNLLINLSMTLVFVGVLKLGIAGSLLAIGCGYTFVSCCTLPRMLWRARLKLRFDIAQNLLSFGVPLVFNFVSYWILQLSDRYLLSRLGSLSQTASYAVAYSLGSVSNVVVISPFILAWPTAMFAIAKRDDAGRVFRLVFRWFSTALLLATFALSLVGIAILDLLFPVSYHAAAPVIPVVALSLMFYGVYNIFAVGVGVRRKTWLTALLMTLAALVNFGLNLYLIPHYGSVGAASSTLIAYAFLALISYMINQRIYPVPFGIPLFLVMLAAGIAFYLSGSSFASHLQGLIATWGVQISALCLYGLCLAALALFVTWREKQRSRQKMEVKFS